MKKQKQQTEIITVESALQKQFKGDAESIAADIYFRAEGFRKQWIAGMLLFGLHALAMKAKLGHGKFRNWLKTTLSTYSNSSKFAKSGEFGIESTKCAKNGTFDLVTSIRNAERYITYTRDFVKRLAEPHGNAPVSIRISEFCKEKKIAEESRVMILADETLTNELIKHVVDGCENLSSFIHDLVEANSDALDEEEAEKNASKKGGSLKGLKGADADDEDPQMTFLTDLFDKVDSIRTIRKNDIFMQLPKKDLQQFGERLMREAKEILQIAKNKKD